MPKDPSVVQNYGSLLEQLVQTVPDGLVPTPESEAINYWDRWRGAAGQQICLHTCMKEGSKMLECNPSPSHFISFDSLTCFSVFIVDVFEQFWTFVSFFGSAAAAQVRMSPWSDSQRRYVGSSPRWPIVWQYLPSRPALLPRAAWSRSCADICRADAGDSSCHGSWDGAWDGACDGLRSWTTCDSWPVSSTGSSSTTSAACGKNCGSTTGGDASCSCYFSVAFQALHHQVDILFEIRKLINQS